MVTVLSILIVPWNEKSRKKGAKVYTKHHPQRLIVSPLSLPWPGLFHVSLMSFKPWIWPSSPGPKMPKEQNVQWFKQWCWKHSQQKTVGHFFGTHFIYFYIVSHILWHFMFGTSNGWMRSPCQAKRPGLIPEIDGFFEIPDEFSKACTRSSSRRTRAYTKPTKNVGTLVEVSKTVLDSFQCSFSDKLRHGYVENTRPRGMHVTPGCFWTKTSDEMTWNNQVSDMV